MKKKPSIKNMERRSSIPAKIEFRTSRPGSWVMRFGSQTSELDNLDWVWERLGWKHGRKRAGK